MKFYYAYILYSQQSKDYYISSAYDLKEALKLHNAGLIKHTKDRKPWELVWYSAFLSYKAAERFADFLESETGEEFYDKWLVSVMRDISIIRSSPSAEKQIDEKKIKPQIKPENARTCPVCGGKGEAANDMAFYRGNRYSKNITICLTCRGKGWLDTNKIVSGK